MFFNLFAATELSINVCVAHGTLCNDAAAFANRSARNERNIPNLRLQFGKGSNARPDQTRPNSGQLSKRPDDLENLIGFHTHDVQQAWRPQSRAPVYQKILTVHAT